MIKPAMHTILIITLLILLPSCTGNESDKFKEHFENAKKYIVEDKLTNATIELRNAIQISPESDQANYLLGETYIKLKDQKRGIYYYSRAAKLNPDNLDAQLKMGQIYIREDKLLDARNIVSRVMEISPKNIEAYHLLAGIQIKEKNVEAAISTMEKAVSLAPKDFKPNMFLASLYDTTGKKRLAEEAYLKTISIDFSQRAPYYELSRLYIRNQQWEKAENILDIFPKYPLYLYGFEAYIFPCYRSD